MRGHKGIALIAVIAIILLAAIIVFGIASFVSNSIALNAGRTYMAGALAAAQCGVYAAVYQYLSDPAQPYWAKAVDQTVYGNTSYSVGKDADFLFVGAAGAARSSQTLNTISLSNLNSAQSIIVNKMKVEWYNFAGTLNTIVLGGVTRWNTAVSSGTTVTLTTPFTLTSKQFYYQSSDNTLTFSLNIPANAIIVVTFSFDSDGSSRKAFLYTSAGEHNEFSITSTGKVSGQGTWKRTIVATYDAGSNKITSWQETENHI